MAWTSSPRSIPGTGRPMSEEPAGPAFAVHRPCRGRADAGARRRRRYRRVNPGARSTAHWLAGADPGRHRPRTSPRRTSPDRSTSDGPRWAWLWPKGAVNVPQARVLVEALDALPASSTPRHAPRPKPTWSSQAGHFGPNELQPPRPWTPPSRRPGHRRRGRVPTPGRRGERARAATRLNFRARGDGSSDINARYPPGRARFRPT